MDNLKTVTNPFYHYQDFWKSENYKTWEQQQTEEFKKYRRLWQESPQKRLAPSAPLSMNIELTDVCNARIPCVMCSKWFLDTYNKFMSFSEAKEILDEAREIGVYAVNLNGAGESLLHKDFVKIVKYAKDKGFIDIMVHSNATMLSEKMSADLIDAGLTRLIASVDSHIPEIYSKIRPSFDFHKVYNNVKKFIELRNEKGKKEPILRITIVVMKQNVDTIQDSVKFWSFADYITVNDCMYFDKFKVFDFDKHRITKIAQEKELFYLCAPLYQQLTVNINKTITICSSVYTKKHGVLGEYIPGTNSLMNVWTGEKLRNIRECHEKGEWLEIKACSLCDLPQIELLKNLRNGQGVMLR